MSEPEFIKLVARMRRAQKDFFKSKSYPMLQESKKLEQEVDQYLAGINAPKQIFD